MNDVDYRPTSRSVVILHSSGFELHDLRRETGDLDLGADETAHSSAASGSSGAAGAGLGTTEPLVADLEALLTLGLMVVWLRDWIIGRTIRPAAVILLVLAGINLYQFWLRRQRPDGVALPEQEPASS